MKRVAILQSNYIPWKGYFDIIHRVDEFIIYDSVQFTKYDWRNRNQIKTMAGLKWLSIPVHQKSILTQAIKDVQVSDPKWPDQHWNSIRHSYSKAPHFETYGDRIQAIYADCRHEDNLSRINYLFLSEMNKILGIDTKLTWITDYPPSDGNPTQRLVPPCQAAGATHYLSGPAAKLYGRR